MTWSSRSFGMVISVFDLAFELVDALFGVVHALPALEGERLGHHADGQRAQLLGDAGDNRRGAGAGAAAHAGGDEHHVGTLDELVDQLGALLGRPRTDLGLAARPEARGSASRQSADG